MTSMLVLQTMEMALKDKKTQEKKLGYLLVTSRIALRDLMKNKVITIFDVDIFLLMMIL